MSTPRKWTPRTTYFLELRLTHCRFDYGDYDPTNNSSSGNPFVQMLSVTNPATMWSEFQNERAATLAQLPPTVDPAVIIQYEGGSNSGPPNSSTSPDGDSLARLSGAVSTDGTSSPSDSDSWLSKYGTIVLGLLGANLLVGIVLLAVSLTMCVRGMKGRSVGSRYTPVRFKDNVEDFERGHMKYSD